jgi:acetyltransferase-like isoleucine patch superfamily enzyme
MIMHPTSEVSSIARIGEGTRIWHQAQVRDGAAIGRNCIVGKGVYVDFDVVIGDNVKIQNGAQLYHGVTLEDGVFVGPLACLTNDRFPRAITPDGHLKAADDWEVGPILVRRGASIGAGAIVLPGVTIGCFALVAAGAVVTTSVPDHGLVMGVPARLVGYVCTCGRRMEQADGNWRCSHCGESL